MKLSEKGRQSTVYIRAAEVSFECYIAFMNSSLIKNTLLILKNQYDKNIKSKWMNTGYSAPLQFFVELFVMHFYIIFFVISISATPYCNHWCFHRQLCYYFSGIFLCYFIYQWFCSLLQPLWLQFLLLCSVLVPASILAFSALLVQYYIFIRIFTDFNSFVIGTFK